MKKLGLICLVIVIALGSLGVGYAAWSQNLRVNGSVATGTFDVVFNSFTAPGSSNGATFSATQTNSHTYTIICNNLYPGLNGVFNFVLKATGTLPAKITAIKVNGINYSSPVNLKLGADSSNDVTVSVSGISTGTNISSGSTVAGTLTLHTWILAQDGNDATPGSTGSFSLGIVTSQQY
jgi:hypothetical protein